jgi:hypothetical protein
MKIQPTLIPLIVFMVTVSADRHLGRIRGVKNGEKLSVGSAPRRANSRNHPPVMHATERMARMPRNFQMDDET